MIFINKKKIRMNCQDVKKKKNLRNKFRKKQVLIMFLDTNRFKSI